MNSNIINASLRDDPYFNEYATQMLRIQRNNVNPRAFFNAIKTRSKNIFFHGAIIAFFVIAVISTFIIGIYGLSRMGEVDWN